MTVKYETFLQEQINNLEIQVSQMQGFIKVLINTTQEIHLRIEDLDERVSPKKSPRTN